jgi:hypothetical protein
MVESQRAHTLSSRTAVRSAALICLPSACVTGLLSGAAAVAAEAVPAVVVEETADDEEDEDDADAAVSDDDDDDDDDGVSNLIRFAALHTATPNKTDKQSHQSSGARGE